MIQKEKRGAKLWPKLAFFLFSLFLVSTQTTDADLLDLEVIPDNTFTATTLDFSNRNTANNLQISSLFSVVGMVPGGFQVESVRIKSDGELDFSYQIYTEINPGGEAFCSQINLTVMQNFNQIYSGSLQEFALNSSLVDKENDDLVIFASFDNSDVLLTNQTCNFNFKFMTTLDESGFIDEEIIQNQISSGVWSALE